MKAVTFAEFFDESKHALTQSQVYNLVGSASYFKLDGGGYCGLIIEPERVWVSILVGGIKDVWHIRREMVEHGVPLVGWKCRPDSRMHKIAKYYGAEIEDSGDTYPDGMIALRCVIHTQQTQRVKKNKEQSQVLN